MNREQLIDRIVKDVHENQHEYHKWIKDVIRKHVSTWDISDMLDFLGIEPTPAFTVYDNLGTPIAYFIKQDNEITEQEMQTIMDLFPEATDNGETLVILQEEG